MFQFRLTETMDHSALGDLRNDVSDYKVVGKCISHRQVLEVDMDRRYLLKLKIRPLKTSSFENLLSSRSLENVGL